MWGYGFMNNKGRYPPFGLVWESGSREVLVLQVLGQIDFGLVSHKVFEQRHFNMWDMDSWILRKDTPTPRQVWESGSREVLVLQILGQIDFGLGLVDENAALVGDRHHVDLPARQLCRVSKKNLLSQHNGEGCGLADLSDSVVFFSHRRKSCVIPPVMTSSLHHSGHEDLSTMRGEEGSLYRGFTYRLVTNERVNPELRQKLVFLLKKLPVGVAGIVLLSSQSNH